MRIACYNFKHIMNRLYSFLLLALFTLLQCVAPIAHAHVNGDSLDQHIHISISGTQGLALKDSEAKHWSVESSHSPVICMPAEHRGEEQAQVLAVACIGKPAFAQPGHIVVMAASPQLRNCPVSPYRLPYSQAPPA
jgi:hypothetical protein